MSSGSPTLRLYQANCIEAVFEAWKTHQSVLAVLPTGTGKSLCFSEIVRRIHPKRSLIVAHRKELIQQAAKHVQNSGLETEIEMAGLKADASMFGNASVIVASVQTLISGVESKRMEKFRPTDFALVIYDEAHRCTASSYRKVSEYFKKHPEIKILGVTATPDRADKSALGQVFEHVAYEYELLQAIEDGYLVEPHQRMVHAGALDFSHIRTTAGDLNGADLEAMMTAERALHEVVGPSIELIGDKKSIAFTCSVKHAELCSNIFNRHKAGMAAWVCGKTNPDDRDRIIRNFKDGDTQVLVNVGVTTEGFDAPSATCVIMARPTKSRALYTQCVGRITRPLPGVIDGLNSAYERKEAIAASAKPFGIVLDFAGNSGRHKLMTTADILGGKYDDETKELAKKKAVDAGGPVSITELLKKSAREIKERKEQAQKEEEARKAKLIAKVQYSVTDVNPFDRFELAPESSHFSQPTKSLSLKQRDTLRRLGHDPDGMSYGQAMKFLVMHYKGYGSQPVTDKQANVLRRYGYDPKSLTKIKAMEILDKLAINGWKKVAA